MQFVLVEQLGQKRPSAAPLGTELGSLLVDTIADRLTQHGLGVIDADLGLSNGDPRAAERTFQLLHQVAGRAGRQEGRGVGLLQTHQPEHPVMRALITGDREAFYAAEIEARERFGYPPFGRLASLVVSGPDKPAAEGFARKLAAQAPRVDDVRLLGPAEAEPAPAIA